MAKLMNLPIREGPDTAELAAALFAPKLENTEYSKGEIYFKAIFRIGEPERLNPCHVTVTSIKAIGDWPEEVEITGKAMLWRTAPIGHGGTTTDEKQIPVSIKYNLRKKTGTITFKD